MKKFSSILALIAVLAVGFVFVGCGDGALEHSLLADTPGKTTGIKGFNKATVSNGIISMAGGDSALIAVQLPTATTTGAKKVKVTFLAVGKGSADIDIYVKDGNTTGSEYWDGSNIGATATLTNFQQTTIERAENLYTAGTTWAYFQRKDNNQVCSLKVISVVIE